MEALAEHRKQKLVEGNYAADNTVFCDTTGGYLRKSNVTRRSLRQILKKANLPMIHFYDLRHMSATLLLLAGVSPKVVSERLGHSTTSQTMDVYSHVLPGMQEQAASKLESVFRQQNKQNTAAVANGYN